MLVVVVALFSFCWLPYHILVLYDNFAGKPTRVFFQTMMFSLWLSFANSCCNPVVYAVLNRNYRREFGRLLRYVRLEIREGSRKSVFQLGVQSGSHFSQSSHFHAKRLTLKLIQVTLSSSQTGVNKTKAHRDSLNCIRFLALCVSQMYLCCV